MLFRQRLQRGSIFTRKFFIVGIGVARIAGTESFNVVPFDRWGVDGQLFRSLDGFKTSLLLFRVYVPVVVWTDGEGDSPQGHRRRLVKFAGALEGTNCFIMVETVEKREALVKVLLCQRSSSLDGVMLAAHSVECEVGLFCL